MRFSDVPLLFPTDCVRNDGETDKNRFVMRHAPRCALALLGWRLPPAGTDRTAG